jgi:Cu/Ag efflux protein CusF
MKKLSICLTAAMLGYAAPLLAQSSADHASHHPTIVAQAAALTDGEVRKVDKETRKITLKHGPIQNLDMPAMTMVFQVKDPAILDQEKPGDKIKFAADKINGAYTVTRIEK